MCSKGDRLMKWIKTDIKQPKLHKTVIGLFLKDEEAKEMQKCLKKVISKGKDDNENIKKYS